MITRLLIVILMASLSGCATGSGVRWWSPATWTSGSAARVADLARAAVDVRQVEAIKAAHVSVAKTARALALAPESQPVELARRFNGNALALLNQSTGILPLQDVRALEALVDALLSENAEIRVAAEAQQRAGEKREATISGSLAVAQQTLAAAQGKLRIAFAKENELANELRNERMVRWALIGVGVLLAAGWIYARFALGGLPMAAGKLMRDLRSSHPSAAEVVAPLFDTYLTPREQSAIAKHAAK